MRLGKFGFGVAVAMAVTACTSIDDVGAIEQGIVVCTGPTVATSQPSYPAGSQVTVDYGCLPGNQFDWVAVAADGSPDSSYLRFEYTNGATDGSWTVGGLAPGSYVARAYENDSFTVLSSATFTVDAPSGVQVATDKPSYAAGESVQVSFSNLPGNQFDWIAVAPHNAAPEVFVDWVYTGGQTAGAVTFSNLAGGQYDARVFENDTYTIIGSASFSVAGTPTVTTDASAYLTGSLVTTSYSNLPGNPTDWVALSTVGSPDTSFVVWKYAQGASGSSSFGNLPAGTYEARIYVNDSFTRIATSAPFTVSASLTPSVSATTPVSANQTISVAWSNLPSNQYDWVAVAPAGSPDTAYLDYFYTAGQSAGSGSFGGLAAGSYEVRAYRNNTFELVTSSSFTVDP